MIEAFVGLGSNLGDRLANLASAVALLSREPGFAVRKVSLAYESEPVGPPQPRYLNAVVRMGTLLSARATLQRLQAIEEQMGRIRRERWGSREIDLDLLLYGDRLVEETGLRVRAGASGGDRAGHGASRVGSDGARAARPAPCGPAPRRPCVSADSRAAA